MISFRHDLQAHEYQAVDEGQVVGKIVYADQGRVRVYTHTETDPKLQGQGIAGRLTRFALDDCRISGLSVSPACPFVREWIERHPEYRDIEA